VRTVSIVTVPIVTASAVAVGVAVHAVGELQANVTLARAGGAVALLALARYAVTTAAPRARWPLVAGLLVFAIAAATSLVWDESALRALPAADCGECFRRLLDGPDLAHVWWVGAVALIGTMAVAVGVALAPDPAPRVSKVSTVVAVVVVVGLAAAEVALLAVAIAGGLLPELRRAAIGAALPGLLAAAAAIVAAVYAAARNRRAAVWVGLVVLAVPALIAAAIVSGQVATAAILGDLNMITPQVVTRDDNLTVLAVLFATAQLVALALVTVGITRRAGPGHGIRATAP